MMMIDYSPIMIAVEKVILKHEAEIAASKVPESSSPIATALAHMSVYSACYMRYLKQVKLWREKYDGTNELPTITLNSGVSREDITRTVAEIVEQDERWRVSCGNTNDHPDAGPVIH